MQNKLVVIFLCLYLSACSNDSKEQRSSKSGFEVTFLGVSTLLISDGETKLMTDGFFSHPGLEDFASIEPDIAVIRQNLAALDAAQLDAVLVLHSHYDHVMDAPEVTRQTGALMLGSESTLNVGRGWGLEEEQMQLIVPGEPYTFGRFTLRFLRSAHVPGLFDDEGETIDSPLTPPTAAVNYKEGGSYSLLISHPDGVALVQATANYRPGALDGIKADVVFLGIGGLFLQEEQEVYQQQYYDQVVTAVAAKTIVPIHWDSLFKPLQHPLTREIGFDEAMAFLETQQDDSGRPVIELLDFAESIVVKGG